MSKNNKEDYKFWKAVSIGLILLIAFVAFGNVTISPRFMSSQANYEDQTQNETTETETTSPQQSQSTSGGGGMVGGC